MRPSERSLQSPHFSGEGNVLAERQRWGKRSKCRLIRLEGATFSFQFSMFEAFGVFLRNETKPANTKVISHSSHGVHGITNVDNAGRPILGYALRLDTYCF